MWTIRVHNNVAVKNNTNKEFFSQIWKGESNKTNSIENAKKYEFSKKSLTCLPGVLLSHIPAGHRLQRDWLKKHCFEWLRGKKWDFALKVLIFLFGSFASKELLWRIVNQTLAQNYQIQKMLSRVFLFHFTINAKFFGWRNEGNFVL